VDFSSLEVVLSVDEIDIASLSEGQTAILTFESFPDTAVGSRVVAIAPKSTSGNNTIVAYDVNLALSETDLPLRTGMTANANLTTAERDDVLLVPNRAISADRTRGTYTVKRLDSNAADGSGFEEVEIEIGLRDGQFTQVLSGLNEGDQLLIGDSIPRAQGGPGPGGGGPGGGGPGN
ncbi:MAG: HlyD family efflux transporter periplasmic adaptor subunit, partial [Anaerolineales bacterium]|nr:HlyD family efflux transporter periplasmic adaptor subunit [Anaerolineales bacterium]